MLFVNAKSDEEDGKLKGIKFFYRNFLALIKKTFHNSSIFVELNKLFKDAWKIFQEFMFLSLGWVYAWNERMLFFLDSWGTEWVESEINVMEIKIECFLKLDVKVWTRLNLYRVIKFWL